MGRGEGRKRRDARSGNQEALYPERGCTFLSRADWSRGRPRARREVVGKGLPQIPAHHVPSCLWRRSPEQPLGGAGSRPLLGVRLSPDAYRLAHVCWPSLWFPGGTQALGTLARGQRGRGAELWPALGAQWTGVLPVPLALHPRCLCCRDALGIWPSRLQVPCATPRNHFCLKLSPSGTQCVSTVHSYSIKSKKRRRDCPSGAICHHQGNKRVY